MNLSVLSFTMTLKLPSERSACRDSMLTPGRWAWAIDLCFSNPTVKAVFQAYAIVLAPFFSWDALLLARWAKISWYESGRWRTIVRSFLPTSPPSTSPLRWLLKFSLKCGWLPSHSSLPCDRVLAFLRHFPLTVCLVRGFCIGVFAFSAKASTLPKRELLKESLGKTGIPALLPLFLLQCSP